MCVRMYVRMCFRLSKLPNANNCELLLGRFTLSKDEGVKKKVCAMYSTAAT